MILVQHSQFLTQENSADLSFSLLLSLLNGDCPHYTVDFIARKFRPCPVVRNIRLSASSASAIRGVHCSEKDQCPVHWKLKIDFQSRKHRGLCSKSQCFLDWKSMFCFQWTAPSNPMEWTSCRYRFEKLCGKSGITALSRVTNVCGTVFCYVTIFAHETVGKANSTHWEDF